jgi:hypothetical protein
MAKLNIGTLLASIIVPTVDWKNLIKTGEDEVKDKAESVLHEHFFTPHKSDNKSECQRIAEKMEKEGWTWDSTDPKVTKVPDEGLGLGRGFVLSRDSLYRIIHNLVNKGGFFIDQWRDFEDNEIWDSIKDNCPEGCSIQTIVEQTANAFIAYSLELIP